MEYQQLLQQYNTLVQYHNELKSKVVELRKAQKKYYSISKNDFAQKNEALAISKRLEKELDFFLNPPVIAQQNLFNNEYLGR
jgi:hypothetical protein